MARAISFLAILLASALFTGATLSAQWQEIQFDDSDMALDLTEALTFQKYPTYEQYLDIMQDFASDYPQICRLDTFGTSVEGRLLLALEISDNPGRNEAEAGFFYTSSMHGDEIVGFVLLLRLAHYLLEGYGNDSEVTDLLNGLSIWINPLANPDGSYSADWGTSLLNASRYTATGMDLNRDFPAPGKGEADDTSGRALENRYMMNFLRDHRFTMSANIHSGAEVVNYPWDHTLVLHADDAWYRFISREYADEAIAVDPGYMIGLSDNGIIHGASWYFVEDGRQDYVNYYLEGREVTLELSNEKLLASDYLEEFWSKNKRSLLNYMSQCLYGIRGVVTDAESGDPLLALIRIPDHDSAYSVVHSTALHGDFYRLIKEGIYDLVVSAPGYLNDTIRDVEVTDYQATPLQISLTADTKSGLDVNDGSAKLILYPNPAGEILFLDAPGAGKGAKGRAGAGVRSHAGPAEIRVWSADGILRIHRQLGQVEFPVSLSLEGLPEGYYILQIHTPDLTRSMGFVKQ